MGVSIGLVYHNKNEGGLYAILADRKCYEFRIYAHFKSPEIDMHIDHILDANNTGVVSPISI